MFSEDIGYAYIAKVCNIPDGFLEETSIIDSRVNKMQKDGKIARYPSKSSPEGDLLSHIAFALKNEPINLFVLTSGLSKIEEKDITHRINTSPNSVPLRMAGYVWEHVHQKELDVINTSASYVKFFNESEYVTGDSKRSSKWRIDFNGLGDLSWCPIIKRTSYIKEMMEKSLLKETSDFLTVVNPEILERAISWLYMSETKSSFLIENEIPSHEKSKAFAHLLSKIDGTDKLDEDFLVAIQNEIIGNPLDKAFCFRWNQNWLSKGPLDRESSITYIPPKPELSTELMPFVMGFANNSQVDEIIKASVLSYSFVYMHPFNDGNGRISRYLIHHALAQSDYLQNGIILPVSVAMENDEAKYLSSLTSFSKPARLLCDVFLDNEYKPNFNWHELSDNAFRYIDLTKQTEYLFSVLDKSLELSLKKEIEFLTNFDRIFNEANKRLDIRNNYLNELIIGAMDNDGKVSNNKRKKFSFLSSEVFEEIEKIINDFNNETIEKTVVLGKIIESDFSGFTVQDRQGKRYEIPLEHHECEVGDRVKVVIDQKMNVQVFVRRDKDIEID